VQLGYDPATRFDTAAFNESISRLSEAKKDTAVVSSRESKLVPDQQQVVDDLQVQCTVYERHITAQQTYLDTAPAIEAGIRALETSNFDTAKSRLTEASESLTADIPEAESSYRLSHYGLSLDQYATLLDLRRQGVSKLLAVCDASVSAEQRQSVSNRALDLFFEARRIVTN